MHISTQAWRPWTLFRDPAVLITKAKPPGLAVAAAHGPTTHLSSHGQCLWRLCGMFVWLSHFQKYFLPWYRGKCISILLAWKEFRDFL